MEYIFEEFCELVDKKIVHNLNFDNPEIRSKLLLFYNSTSENRITRLREEVKSVLDIQGNPRQKNYWISRGWNTDIAQRKIYELQSKIGKQTNKNGSLNYRFTKDWYIEKYGEEKGIKLYEDKNYRCGPSLERNIERYGEKEGYKKYKERSAKSAVTKAKMIEKSGYDEGIIKWGNYRKRQAYTCTLDYFIEKYGVQGEDIWYETYKGFKGRSKIAEKLFESLPNKDKAYFGDEEYFISLNLFDQERLDQKVIWPDFVLNKKIIEFFGDNIHGNPIKYSADDILSFYRTKVRAQDVWDRDNTRINILIEKGYEVLVIWEKDFKEDPTETVRQCKTFLES